MIMASQAKREERQLPVVASMHAAVLEDAFASASSFPDIGIEGDGQTRSDSRYASVYLCRGCKISLLQHTNVDSVGVPPRNMERRRKSQSCRVTTISEASPLLAITLRLRVCYAMRGMQTPHWPRSILRRKAFPPTHVRTTWQSRDIRSHAHTRHQCSIRAHKRISRTIWKGEQVF
jgi:hypothetical protein